MIFVLISNSPPGIAGAASPVSMNVINGEVRDVLTALASVGQVNIVVDDSVAGTVTIKLQDVPFETALDLIARTKGLAYQKIGSVIVVADSQRLGKNFGSIHYFQLKYANPHDIVNVLSLMLSGKQAQFNSGESGVQVKLNGKSTTETQSATIAGSSSAKSSGTNRESERFVVNDSMNAIIFYGTPREAEQVRQILDHLDVAYQQVSLEAQVIAVAKDKVKELGIEWMWEKTPQYAEYDAPKLSPIQDQDGNTTGYYVSDPGKVTRRTNSGIIQYGKTPEGHPYEFYFQAQLNALISNGNARVLAKPKITTLNGQQARILIGDRIPVLVEKTENGQTSTSVEYIDAGIKLTFTPRINTDSLITAAVRTEVSSPSLVPEIKAYRITTREAETNVRMKDGETMVIGGLIGSTETETKKSVPYLCDLPLIGWLFKNSTHSKSDTEVVIFLTARIVK
ncbi:type IV pilus biogenesis and competence protein PilQ precursor [Methylomusa anaerophila]|uniref:Type IV pilus biogenesis and competence protein PilQ n=1 Tax=Methylomusa anaerophila TaxID=1930071 RepID=A0A348AQG2_9FIRM|nr:type IV pilus biogenesis and competence protein PilQ precursor [Methylomusa anaerophila]